MEAGADGAYNVISPSGHATMGALLDACVQVAGGPAAGSPAAEGPAELRWTDPEVVLAAGIEPWIQLPVWVPPGSESHDAMHRADVSRAVGDGLRCRPVAETVADTWSWLQGIGGTAPQRPDRPVVGLDPSVEAKVLGG